MKNDIFLLQLVANMKRNPRVVAQQLGLENHPKLVDLAVREDRGESIQTSYWMKILTSVVYRCDPDTQFYNHSDAKKEHDRLAKQRKNEQSKLVETFPRLKLTKENLMSNSRVLHFVSNATFGDMYSVSREFEHLFVRVSQVMHRPPLPAQKVLPLPSADDLLENDTMNMQIAPTVPTNRDSLLFFRFIDFNSQRLKLVKTNIGSGGKLLHGDCMVAMHPMMRTFGEAMVLSLKLPEHGLCVLRVGDIARHPGFFLSLQKWSRDNDHMQYTFDLFGLQAAAADGVIKALLDHKAVEPVAAMAIKDIADEGVHDIGNQCVALPVQAQDENELLCKLEKEAFVRKSDAGWTLSRKGLQCIQYGYGYRLAEQPAEEQPIDMNKATVFELRSILGQIIQKMCGDHWVSQSRCIMLFFQRQSFTTYY